MTAELSVIIPTYRREQVLLDAASHLLRINGHRVELILVDQTEEHEQNITSHLTELNNRGSIRWLRRSQPSIPGSMNAGAAQATAPYLLFLDDDIVPDGDLYLAHLQAHRTFEGGIVAGRVLQPWHDEQHDSDPFTRTSGEYRQEFMGGNFSIRRDLLIELGGFDENFKGAAYNFEREFADRLLTAGHRIWYEPAALIRHLHHASGGTRSKGDHLTSWNPRHPVGAYYYLLVSPRINRRLVRMAKRLIRSVVTRHHLKKPWYIPVTLVSELAGLAWAVRLRMLGPALPFPTSGVAGAE